MCKFQPKPLMFLGSNLATTPLIQKVNVIPFNQQSLTFRVTKIANCLTVWIPVKQLGYLSDDRSIDNHITPLIQVHSWIVLTRCFTKFLGVHVQRERKSFTHLIISKDSLKYFVTSRLSLEWRANFHKVSSAASLLQVLWFDVETHE